jgi:hypothetical protein
MTHAPNAARTAQHAGCLACLLQGADMHSPSSASPQSPFLVSFANTTLAYNVATNCCRALDMTGKPEKEDRELPGDQGAAGGYGGVVAIYTDNDFGGIVLLRRSRVIGNYAAGNGSVIYSNVPMLYLGIEGRTRVTGNTAVVAGGVAYVGP